MKEKYGIAFGRTNAIPENDVIYTLNNKTNGGEPFEDQSLLLCMPTTAGNTSTSISCSEDIEQRVKDLSRLKMT